MHAAGLHTCIICTQHSAISTYQPTTELYNFVTIQLLDMCRRLDAMEVNGFSDPLEGAEVATLRVLMSVSQYNHNTASEG